ncbi:MAG: LysM peptidoglycan-binding domain-containing protein [Proteobacteria bacterium]|nr:LysM peptidoglycan-binding domain-containing protein [Pseudomonadota bacterium]MBU1640782.1 LysM peptidoglycan-binding domain-containing protein [Pseudomonadota bacterium]
MASSEPFPIHASMRPNVEFWKKIYSEYPSTQGVLHDSNNLKIIYEVIELEPHGPGSSRVNSERIKKAKDRYLSMLDKFARGQAPSTQLECRIYDMFGPNPKREEFRQARDDIRCQTGQKDRFLAGVKRSGKYLERIKDIFRSQGLPEDLAYLPHVESSYNYEAYSKFGAAGIWQFTRSTGQRYMQVDYVVDERRDPIAASYAAAKFLKENHDLLGSWPLALTAYNHGPNGMLRAKKEMGDYARIFDEYDGKRFKFASRNFYSEYIAARHVAKNYRLYFGNVNVDKPVIYHSIELEGYAPMASICNFFHVGMDEIKCVNPALRSPVFDGQKHIPKGYRLRLPGHSQKMARMSSVLPASLFERGQKRSNFYRVQRGDTAGKIAKRHNVSINELAAANGLSRRATIYVGQNLRIPAGDEKSTMLASASGNSKRSPSVPTMAILKEQVLAKATAQEKSSSPVVGSLAKWRPRGNPQGLIAAREEETPPPSLVARAEKKVVEALEIPLPAAPEEQVAVLDEIPALAQAETVVVDISEIEPPMVVAEVAQQPLSVLEEIVEFVLPAPGVEAELVSELAEDPRENLVLAEDEVFAMASDAVEEEEGVGAEVEVAEAVESFETIEAAEVVNPLVLVGNFDVGKMKTVKGTATGTIQVEVEETLGHYADWLEIPTQNIRRLNSYRYGKPIQYGQKLKLPFAKVSKEDFEERRYLYHKEMVEDFFVAYKIDGDKTYRVKKGDNLWTLCHDDFELPFWLIKQYNSNFDFHALRLGSEIKVPVVSKVDSDSQVAEVNPGSLPGKPLAKRISVKKLAIQ